MSPALSIPQPTAVIAEDEPLLAAALQAELARAWPELKILQVVGDGLSAVQAALQHQPDVLFLDIRMPGQTGLEACAELADEWPDADAGTVSGNTVGGSNSRPFPAVVFVTAYDEYAIAAFEAQAADYLLKPVQPARLAQAVQRLQERLATKAVAVEEPSHRRGADGLDEATLAKLRALLSVGATSAPATRLQVIQAGTGTQLKLIPVEEVLVFEAADKYVRVLTADHESLIRTPLKELLPQLDPEVFWQIHRGTVVRCTAIDTVERDEAGKIKLTLRQRKEAWPVSRLHASRFRAM